MQKSDIQNAPVSISFKHPDGAQNVLDFGSDFWIWDAQFVFLFVQGRLPLCLCHQL